MDFYHVFHTFFSFCFLQFNFNSWAILIHFKPMLKVGYLVPTIICDHSRFNHSVQDKLDPECHVVFILALVFAVPSDFQIDRRCHSQACRFSHQECIATFFRVLFFQLGSCIAVRPLAIDELIQVSQFTRNYNLFVIRHFVYPRGPKL
nr:MAG TPA: hypothetical protein [Caudoviricetes sp.]